MNTQITAWTIHLMNYKETQVIFLKDGDSICFFLN